MKESEKKKIEIAFNDPSFSLLVMEALLGSAQTQSKEKHKVLARIVSERLRCEPDSLLALASNLACKAVISLTSKQLKVLGLVELIHSIRPISFPEISSPEREQWYMNWLREELSLFLPLGDITLLDLLHLESLSCLSITLEGYSLEFILCPEVKDKSSRPYKEFSDVFKGFINEDPLGKELKQLWDNQLLNRARLTSCGKLIGIYVHDELTGTTTLLHGWNVK